MKQKFNNHIGLGSLLFLFTSYTQNVGIIVAKAERNNSPTIATPFVQRDEDNACNKESIRSLAFESKVLGDAGQKSESVSDLSLTNLGTDISIESAGRIRTRFNNVSMGSICNCNRNGYRRPSLFHPRTGISLHKKSSNFLLPRGGADYIDDDEEIEFYNYHSQPRASHNNKDQRNPNVEGHNRQENYATEQNARDEAVIPGNHPYGGMGGGAPASHVQDPSNRQNQYDPPDMPVVVDVVEEEPPLPPAYGGSPYGQETQEYHSQSKPPPLPQRQAAPKQQLSTVSTRPPQPHPDQEKIQDSSPKLDLEQFDKDLIFSGLKRMYRKKILPLEIESKFGHFHSPPLSPSDFDAKPMVLLLGQYSVGKTSFIRYLLGRNFPGIRVGPEPTTDRFTAIFDGNADKVIPGAALASQSDRPFRGLSPFGNNFLSRMEGIEIENAPILRNITLVDTPGILAGLKQSQGRNYDYDAVMKWFAERADLIIVMFDAHKLDISDELKRVIHLMKPHADKVRVVLNKADSVDTQQLMRVYGALMWSLGKVMDTPEVCRVYIGSFWGAPLKNREQAGLLQREKLDLFADIAQLPQNAVMRRINELVKRARSVKVHAYIIHYLRKQLPYTFGKREKQRRLIDRLDRELIMCARRYELPKGDFPPIEPLRQALLEIKDLSEFPKLDKRKVQGMDKVFSVEIPELLEKARDH